MAEKDDLPGNNNKFHKKAVENGYCCRYAAIRMNVRPQDTIARLSAKFEISTACLKRNRAGVRDGTVKCERRDKCLRALWLTPTERKKEYGEPEDSDA